MELFGVFFFIGLLVYLFHKADRPAALLDQQCGYCDQTIRWVSKEGRWRHADGNVRAIGRADLGYWNHGACPPPSAF